MADTNPRLWRRYLVFGLILLGPGWLMFDGVHALVTGDYLTPSSGRFAGQLGPWAHIFEAIGIDPRSLAVKLLHLAIGAANIAVGAAWTFGRTDLRKALTAVVILSAWYIPFGTLAALIILILLWSGFARRA
ncbi:MAG: hypothetical protein ACE5FO_06525 [Parvularculaceae bacterium]